MAIQETNKRAEEICRWEREDELRKADEERRSRCENAQEGNVTWSREKEWLRRQYRTMLSALPYLSTTEDLESYLNKLENHIKQCKVRLGKWPFYHSAKITGQYLEIVRDLI